jgi:hypothetical protein
MGSLLNLFIFYQGFLEGYEDEIFRIGKSKFEKYDYYSKRGKRRTENQGRH